MEFFWLRQCLVQHKALKLTIRWGTPQEREAERLDLVTAGLLPAGFENCVFICDGTKDLAQRARIYEAQEREYSALKGHGKSHLLFTDLSGRPMHVEAGIQGNENDRGAYKRTKIYQHPDEYLLPHHTGLFDGVFQGELHCKTQDTGVLPASRSQLAKAPPAMRELLRKSNRCQRRLRVPVEQVFGIIKEWGLVGHTLWRGDVELQGVNFLLCTQLTTWLMDARKAYPRGQKWRNAELEEWEVEMREYLEVDPLARDLYE